MVVVNATEPQFHGNGAPFQLGGKQWQSDAPDDGESYVFDVGAGDVVLACTDRICACVSFSKIN